MDFLITNTYNCCVFSDSEESHMICDTSVNVVQVPREICGRPEVWIDYVSIQKWHPHKFAIDKHKFESDMVCKLFLCYNDYIIDL